jgi:hypothetical protein
MGASGGDNVAIRTAYRFVMAGLVPAIHALLSRNRKTWMPGTSPGMTAENSAQTNEITCAYLNRAIA